MNRLHLPRLSRRVLLIAALAFSAGCGGGGGNDPSPSRGAKWTFLVYLNAANDLETYSIPNMNQMERVGSNDDVNIVVQWKRIQSNQSWDETGEGDWAGTRRYYVTRDDNGNQVNSRLLSDEGTLDMGDPQTLRDFVDWGVSNYPAQKYCLVIWNHGAGWRSSRNTPVPGRGVSEDVEFGTKIDTIALPGAIGLGQGRKWDVVAFDASLMQMAEVAHEIRDQAQYIVGSEESPPGEGYFYDAFLNRLRQNPDMGGREFATHIVQDTFTSYQSTGKLASITHSALDASKVGAIAPAVDALGASLLAAAGQYGAQIARARDFDVETYAYPENGDLIHFTQLLSQSVPDPGVQAAIGRVQGAVRDALIANVHGNAHPNSNGLAILLTDPATYRSIDDRQFRGFGQRYTALAFAQAAPNWQAFLAQGPP